MTSTNTRGYKYMLRRLKAARAEAGLTQVQVAKRLRVYSTWLQKIEAGERRLDPLELQALAKIYDKPLDYFLP